MGILLALIALGLSLIYGLMNINNLAHGSMFMLGAVITAYLCNSLRVPFWAAVLIAPGLVALLTLLLNDILFVRMLGKDIAVSVLATAGLLLTIDNAVLAVFGGEPASIDAPTAEAVEVLGLAYPAYRLVAAGIAICVLVAVGAFLKFTRYGLFMRAVPQSRARGRYWRAHGAGERAHNRAWRTDRRHGRRVSCANYRRSLSNGAGDTGAKFHRCGYRRIGESYRHRRYRGHVWLDTGLIFDRGFANHG